MDKHFSLIDSFKCAFKGVFFVICHERNMRIHIVAALYAAFFSVFYEFSQGQVGDCNFGDNLRTGYDFRGN